MASRPVVSIEERLHRAQVAIDNALIDAGIKAALAPFGYDEARLQEGKALYNNTLSLHQTQRREYGEQYDATENLKDIWEQADSAYMDAVKVARIALRNMRGKWQALALDGSRKQSLSGWLEQAQQFYVNALSDSDIVAAMSRFGFDQTKLQAGQQLVQQVAEANALQEKEKGEAQDATEKRDAVLDELDQWISDFKVIATIALKDNAQWIEKLGLAVVE